PDQDDFNLQRWEEVMADPHYAQLDGTFETNRFGQVIHMPPPSFLHARLQSQISLLLSERLTGGGTATECPVSTSDGVKGVDVAWLSDEQLQAVGAFLCVPFAPTICVEIKSPSNSRSELEEKKALYFEAGAREVWICDEKRAMTFYLRDSGVEPSSASLLCPTFPPTISV
ncbi:MAG: Uma2 family endonuclease, partial [Verrucomicrobiota bacterium]